MFFVVRKIGLKIVLINEKLEIKRLPKYNKNENKLHLKEGVEKKSTDDLRHNTMGRKKEEELPCKKRK